MKNLLIIASFSLLISVSSAWAQSTADGQSHSDKKSPSSVNKASQATNSQLKGSGVPYNKEKQQSGKTPSTRNNKPLPPSSVTDGPEVSDAANAKKGITPGSHTAQRERSVGHKSATQTANPSPKKNNP